MNHFIDNSICIIDCWQPRRQKISQRLAKQNYEVVEADSVDEFLSCSRSFSLLIAAHDGNGRHELRMLCTAATVPVILLSPEDEWARLAYSQEFKTENTSISVSHMNLAEITWRVEALLQRAAACNFPDVRTREPVCGQWSPLSKRQASSSPAELPAGGDLAGNLESTDSALRLN